MVKTEVETRRDAYSELCVMAAVQKLRPEWATLQPIRLLAGVSTRRTVDALSRLVDSGALVHTPDGRYREANVGRSR